MPIPLGTWKPLSAKNARVQVGSTNLFKSEWNIVFRNPPINSTNFEGGGFHEEISSVDSAVLTVRGLWNSAANEFANPPNIVSGRHIGPVTVYHDLSNTVAASFSNMRVEQVTTRGSVEGGIEFEFTANSVGPFTAPDGINPGPGNTE